MCYEPWVPTHLPIYSPTYSPAHTCILLLGPACTMGSHLTLTYRVTLTHRQACLHPMISSDIMMVHAMKEGLHEGADLHMRQGEGGVGYRGHEGADLHMRRAHRIPVTFMTCSYPTPNSQIVTANPTVAPAPTNLNPGPKCDPTPVLPPSTLPPTHRLPGWLPDLEHLRPKSAQATLALALALALARTYLSPCAPYHRFQFGTFVLPVPSPSPIDSFKLISVYFAL